MTDSSNSLMKNELEDPSAFFVGLIKERTPERSGALQNTIDKYGIQFATNMDVEKCLFSSKSQSGIITIGMKGSSRLLGHSFAYVSAHLAVINWIASIKQGTPTTLIDSQGTIAASKLLVWATTTDIRCIVDDVARSLTPEFLPEDLASLIDECLSSKAKETASEIYANAIVWILYHEISHIQMGHVYCEGFESIEQERQADRMASDWMLGSECIEPIDRCKRQWGIATALGWLTAMNVFFGPGSRKTHPAAYDRLYQTLSQFVNEDDDYVWMYVQVILMLHIVHAGLKFSEALIGPPFKENANRLIDVIAAVGKG